MNHTQKLLQRVADGAHTGADGCDWLLERTEDEEMRRELAAERRQYAQFADRAERALTESGVASDASASDMCDALIAQFTSPNFVFDGLTGEGMTWSESGEVTKSPKGMVIENGAYVGMD